MSGRQRTQPLGLVTRGTASSTPYVPRDLRRHLHVDPGRPAFRKKIYGSIPDLQVDLDRWVQSYNEERPHQGRWCFGKTPMQTFLDATPLAKEKMIAA